MTVDWTKPIQTRDGRKAEFVRRVKARADTQKIWCVVEHSGFEEMASFTEDGQHFEVPTNYDIVNVPEEEHLCAVLVYPNGHCAFASRSIPGFTGNRTHVVTITRCGDEVTATVEKVQ